MQLASVSPPATTSSPTPCIPRPRATLEEGCRAPTARATFATLSASTCPRTSPFESDVELLQMASEGGAGSHRRGRVGGDQAVSRRARALGDHRVRPGRHRHRGALRGACCLLGVQGRRCWPDLVQLRCAERSPPRRDGRRPCDRSPRRVPVPQARDLRIDADSAFARCQDRTTHRSP